MSSFPFSDCFPDLLCSKASSCIIPSSAGEDYSPEYSSDFESPPPDFEESIVGLLEDERDLFRSISSQYSNHQSVDASVRSEYVAWIIKVQQHYGFQPLTAYLSVNYFDRFLLSHHLPKKNGWPLQLLSVACLSLAAKMEEPLVPSLLDFQVEGAKFIFEPRTIQRMELLVLSVLDWRLRSVSPFCYLRFFAHKIDPTGTYTAFLETNAKEIILKTIKEACFLEYKPSCVASATILCAANDLQEFAYITAQNAVSWCNGLIQEDEIMSCYQLIRRIVFSVMAYKQPKVLPHLRVMSTRASINTISSDSSSSSSSYKRRKLNNNSCANDDKRS
ncbi:hypothetical protein CASFOL_020867 [Castilleja foliolosa]|uniref:Cyclin D1 n=1 Tax=Castilleja foliolosa TaxID=1961234 RepID=A0ABD3D238_9LAMI